MNIGDRIRNRRIELGLTQSELAKKMGYTSRTSICTIEKNKENLTTSRVIKLAEALNTTPSFLMGWVDEHGNEIPSIDYYKLLSSRPELKELVDTAIDLSPDDIAIAISIMKRMKK